MNEPTAEQWLELHEAFREYCRIEPWRWFDDTGLVIVRHPSTKETSYCIVMGEGGMQYGLVVYRGDEGLAGYLGVISGAIQVGEMETLDVTNALAAMLDDRENLTKQERDTIRSLGLRYRGRGQWPSFQDFTPGYMPWNLDAAGAVSLTWALRSISDLSLRVEEGDVNLDSGDDTKPILTRTWDNDKWRDQWEPLEFPLPPSVPDYPDSDRLRQLAASKPVTSTTWELNISYFHAPLREERGSRPHFPMMAMLAESESGFLVHELFAGRDPSDTDRQQLLVKLLEALPGLPSEIVVSTPRTARRVESVTYPLGIELSVDETPLVWSLRNELLGDLDEFESDDF